MRGYRAERAFDGTRARPDGALVLVDDGRIVGVEPASAPAPDGCEVVDLPGTTLLPGLIDTHVHLCGDSGSRALDQVPELSAVELQRVIATAERQHLRAGVTTVRDLGDHRWTVLNRIASDGKGTAENSGDVRPRVVGSGPPITSPGGHCWSMGGEASTEDGLRRAVRERVDRGAAVVKIMSSGGVMTSGTDVFACQFTVEELRAAVDEAHRHGLPVTAHAHALTAVESCVEAGVDGIEHCSCMTPEEVRTPVALTTRLAEAGTYVCPTLGRTPGVDLPPQMLAILASMGATYDDHLSHVALLHRAGVTLLAGTDAGIGPGKRHGLVPVAVAELVGCGVPPPVALSGATALAARACGLEGRTGRLAPGLDADLLMVDGDAVADVSSVQRPRLVVSRGREVSIRDTA